MSGRVAKTFSEIIKFNPYHDSRGRFTTSSGYTSFTYSPGKSKAHDLAIQREKERAANNGIGGSKKQLTVNQVETTAGVIDMPKLKGDRAAEAEEARKEKIKAVEELEQLKTAFVEWEKKASQLKANAEKALSEYATAQKSGKTARAEYETAKAKYEKFKESKASALAKLKANRDSLAPAVDEEIMTMYKQLTDEGKYPAFVAQLGEEKFPTCGACGMMLSDTAKRDLNANGYCRCETCHRIIYKP